MDFGRQVGVENRTKIDSGKAIKMIQKGRSWKQNRYRIDKKNEIKLGGRLGIDFSSILVGLESQVGTKRSHEGVQKSWKNLSLEGGLGSHGGL